MMKKIRLFGSGDQNRIFWDFQPLSGRKTGNISFIIPQSRSDVKWFLKKARKIYNLYKFFFFGNPVSVTYPKNQTENRTGGKTYDKISGSFCGVDEHFNCSRDCAVCVVAVDSE